MVFFMTRITQDAEIFAESNLIYALMAGFTHQGIGHIGPLQGGGHLLRQGRS